MHLITGFAGTHHVTSANDGVRNAQIFGQGRYVVGIGERLKAQIINNNSVRIYDGYGIMDGRFFEIQEGSYEDLTIDNGTQAKNRIDLICARYEKSENTGIETVSLVVVKGTPAAGTPTTPAINEGDIIKGDMLVDFPLYKVTMQGLNLVSVISMFGVVEQGVMDRISELETSLNWNKVEGNTSVSIPETWREMEIGLGTGSGVDISKRVSKDMPLNNSVVSFGALDIYHSTQYISGSWANCIISSNSVSVKDYYSAISGHITDNKSNARLVVLYR